MARGPVHGQRPRVEGLLERTSATMVRAPTSWFWKAALHDPRRARRCCGTHRRPPGPAGCGCRPTDQGRWRSWWRRPARCRWPPERQRQAAGGERQPNMAPERKIVKPLRHLFHPHKFHLHNLTPDASAGLRPRATHPLPESVWPPPSPPPLLSFLTQHLPPAARPSASGRPSPQPADSSPWDAALKLTYFDSFWWPR